jgi:hypothetical protein
MQDEKRKFYIATGKEDGILAAAKTRFRNK